VSEFEPECLEVPIDAPGAVGTGIGKNETVESSGVRSAGPTSP